MRLKALFLLVIFLLNTLVGFACALQIEYQSQEKIASKHHNHSSHAHNSSSSKIAHNHDSHASADHDIAHKHSEDSSDEDSSCCKDEVNKFYSLDKIAPQSGKIIAKAPVSEIVLFYYIPLNALHIEKGYSKYIDNRQRPPTSDIRIAIQSFQI